MVNSMPLELNIQASFGVQVPMAEGPFAVCRRHHVSCTAVMNRR